MKTGAQASEGIGMNADKSGMKKRSTGRSLAIRKPSTTPVIAARPSPAKTR
jgi:hypothetical protein